VRGRRRENLPYNILDARSRHFYMHSPKNISRGHPSLELVVGHWRQSYGELCYEESIPSIAYRQMEAQIAKIAVGEWDPNRKTNPLVEAFTHQIPAFEGHCRAEGGSRE